MSEIPSQDQIRQWIIDHPEQSTKRDIATAFNIRGAGKIALKRMLAELEAEGAVPDRRERRLARVENTDLPPVAVLLVLAPDANGDLFARPLEDAHVASVARILVRPQKGDPALAEGMRILARLTPEAGEDYTHTARLIRALGGTALKMLGIFRATQDGGRIMPIDKGADKEWAVAGLHTADAQDGELVEAEQIGARKHGGRLGLPQARITLRLGDPSAAKSVSLIAIHQHGIPDAFPDEVVAQAEAAKPAPLTDRTDLRHLNLVTIDPVDARDRDDAVLALPDGAGGHIIWVAIADVAHYVRPATPLDREARKRGNSTYFPDRVVPMLPDALSGDLCSLHQDVDRACLAVEMRFDTGGHKTGHRFVRGLMRSRASLNYAQVQAAIDGAPDAQTLPLLDSVLRPLYAAYEALKLARNLRQPLDLELPERKIILDETGRVTSVSFRDRFDAHKLIEECMIAANVAAAEELNARKSPLLFRVHEEPSPEKLDALREVATASGFVLAKGQVLQTAHLNRLLAQAAGTDFDELMNIATLRSMTQAYYSPQNFGHFGLALRNYAHFTSPIRRYSDLIVHRALIAAHGWGSDGLSDWDIENLPETAKQISDTERRSMLAERDTSDRYLAAFLSDRVGAEFSGRISGVQRFGLFVKLDETGADGLVPVRAIGREYFHYDPEAQVLVGSESGQTLGAGLRVTVRLAEASPLTGGLILDLLNVEGATLPTGKRGGKGSYGGRKSKPAATKEAKTARKVMRKRRG
jgi:ribonuclease R